MIKKSEKKENYYSINLWKTTEEYFFSFYSPNCFRLACNSMNSINCFRIRHRNGAVSKFLSIERKTIFKSLKIFKANVKPANAKDNTKPIYSSSLVVAKNCNEIAIKYPNGFFQSNGNLEKHFDNSDGLKVNWRIIVLTTSELVSQMPFFKSVVK